MEAPRSTSDTSRLAAVVRAGLEAPVRPGSRAALPTSAPTGAVYSRTSDGETVVVDAYGHEIAVQVTMAARIVRDYVQRQPGRHGSVTVEWDPTPDVNCKWVVGFAPGGDGVVMTSFINGQQTRTRVLSTYERANDVWIGGAIQDWFVTDGGGGDDEILVAYIGDRSVIADALVGEIVHDNLDVSYDTDDENDLAVPGL